MIIWLTNRYFLSSALVTAGLGRSLKVVVAWHSSNREEGEEEEGEEEEGDCA